MRASFVTLATVAMLLTGFNALPSSAAAEMNTAAVESVANATLHNIGGRTKKSETDDPTGLAFTDEDADSNDELSPSTKGAEDEERALFKPSASTESLWVKVFYKIFPHVKRPAPEIKHKPLRPPRFIDAGDGMVYLSTKH